MKKIILITVIFHALYNFPQVREIGSQTYFKQGDIEINFSMNLGAGFSTSTNTTSTKNFSPYDSSYNIYTNTYSERPFNFMLTSSIGYCVIDGLSIEPELDINLITDEDISISLLANLTYNFNITRKTTYPFITVGYGLSNYNTYSYYSNSGNNNSLDTKVFNAGLGIKFFYTSGTAMTMEINYKNLSNSVSSSYDEPGYYQSATTTDFSIEVITIAIGFSVLL